MMRDNGTRPNIGWYRATGAGGREETVGGPNAGRRSGPWRQSERELTIHVQVGRNLTDEKSIPTTFTDDRHADEGRPHRE